MDFHQSFGPDYSTNYFLNASVGYGYRMGNGVDYSFVLGGDLFSPMGRTISSSLQFRYHVFNNTFSPFISLGAGFNYYLWLSDCAPTVRIAIGMSLGQFSVSFTYGESWIGAEINENVYKRVGTGLPTFSLNYSF